MTYSEWQPEPMIRVRVDAVEPSGPRSTVRVGLGTDDDGRRIMFAGSTSEMHRIQAALEEGAIVVAEVPPFAVLVASLPRGDAA